MVVFNTLASSLMVPLVYLDYNMRKEYIAEVLCINKEEPITVCGGKCYLDNQLNILEEQTQQEALPSKLTVNLSFYFVDFPQFLEPNQIKAPIKHASIYPNGTVISYHNSIFHPPKN